jgi:PD-(D/E)XK nuclease superfamily
MTQSASFQPPSDASVEESRGKFDQNSARLVPSGTSPDEREGLPSASRWRGYELCYKSFQLQQEAERLGQSAHQNSPWAKSGKRMHAYLAGQPDEDGREVVLTDTERTTADFLQQRSIEQAQRIFGDQKTESANEQRLYLIINGQKVGSGRYDRLIWTPEIALVQDFKTSQWVEPDKTWFNAQMRVLAILVGLNLPDTIKEVVTQVITGPWGVYEERYTRKELAEIYDATLATLRKINDPGAPLVPGILQCCRCSAINNCSAVKGLVPLTSEAIALPDGDRGAALLDSVEILQKRLDAIREYYYERLSEDPAFALPGWGLAPGPGRREVGDWKAARTRLEEFIGTEELEQLVNYSIPSVEKLIARTLKLKTKEAGLKLAEILGNLLIVRQGNLCLKRVKGAAKVASLEAM